MEKQVERFFIGALIVTVVIKILLALAVPMTSDEAYFYLWGRYPALGYYDHPPMIGWILYGLLFLGKSPLLLRLPPIIFSTLVGAGIYFVLRRFDRLKAALVAVFFLLSPINLLNVLVTTDTPLLLFSFASCVFLFAALESRNYLHYLLAGVFLGLAFMSKYFAVLLGAAYFVYFLFSEKDKRKTAGFLVLYAALVPFVAFHIYWNYLYCWPNIMFNLINRNRNEAFSLGKVLVFIVCQLYLLTPPVIYYLYRKRNDLAARFADRRFTVFLFAFLVPLAAFAVLSFKKVIGLHWVLSFYPFMYIALFLLLTPEELLKSIRFMLFFALAHLFLIGTALSLPVRIAQHNKNYGTIIMGMHPGELLKYFRQYEGSFTFATPSYADSALLEYHYGRHVIVFGGGSYHARHDDILTDFTRLKGGNIAVIRTSAPKPAEYEPYFEKVEIKPVNVEGAVFYFVLGYGFNYEVYKEKVLVPIRDKFYDIPKFLPYKSCPFLDKYFS